MQNRSVPTSSVVPHLFYRSVSDACDWLTRVFGFSERFRYGEPVSGIQMAFRETIMMLSSPRPGRDSPAQLGGLTQMLTLIVEDVDAHYDRIRREGAEIFEELNETVYGERQYGVKDLDGHCWLFSQHAHDLSPEDWGATSATEPLQAASGKPRR